MSISAPIDLEVCVDSLESAFEAIRKGASTIELCCNAHEGGYSPSIGLLKVIKTKVSVPIFVVVRPYRDDYAYSESEFETMQEEIQFAKHIGASGFIFGILTSNNQVDITRCSILVNLCRPLPCTFSTAFEKVANPLASLEEIIKCGFERILVSSDIFIPATGKSKITALQEHAQNRIKIISAGKTPAFKRERSLTDDIRVTDDSLGSFSLASIIIHPTVLNKLKAIDIRQVLADLLSNDLSSANERYSTCSPLESSPASPQMVSVQRLRNMSPSNDTAFRSLNSPDGKSGEYVSAFNPLKPTIMVSGSDTQPAPEAIKPQIQRRDSLQVPDMAGLLAGITRRRSLDDPSGNSIIKTIPMDTTEILKECNNLKKERSLSAPEALYHPNLAEHVFGLRQESDNRILAFPNNNQNSMRALLRMNVRRGPLQKKLDALKASTHIDEEFNAVMNNCSNDYSNNSDDSNQNLNKSLREMEIGDYNQSCKRKRSYGPNQKKIDDSNLMHALKSGLEFTRTLKQESDFKVFKNEVELLYEGSECVDERTICCGKCGKLQHLSWLRYHQQFNTEHWVHCHIQAGKEGN